MKTKQILAAAYFAVVSFVCHANADTIYRHDFSGDSATNLNGLAPDVNNYTGTGADTWLADTNALRDWRADGSIDNGGETADYNGFAFLPFKAEAGKVYTLSIDMNVTGAAWFALGFMSDNITTGGGFYDRSTGDGAPWMLLKGDGAAGKSFAGPSLEGEGVFASRDGNTASITLDTTGDDWVATFVNGSVTNTHTYTGVNISDDINYVGFGRHTEALGSVDNFSLTVIPEPSTIGMLLGVAAMGRLFLRRRMG